MVPKKKEYLKFWIPEILDSGSGNPVLPDYNEIN
uniref:Uncharacterized protein n=1 Tax=Arundo donax TaxID=35708 RepID=A0A0A8Y7B8_ARUDO